MTMAEGHKVNKAKVARFIFSPISHLITVKLDTLVKQSKHHGTALEWKLNNQGAQLLLSWLCWKAIVGLHLDVYKSFFFPNLAW